jgi:DHA2 family multidrug resistance protein
MSLRLAVPHLAIFFSAIVVTPQWLQLSLSSVPPKELPSAAGLQNFLRIMAIAVSTSVVMTYWNDQARVVGSDLAGKLNPDTPAGTVGGFSVEQSRVLMAQLIDREALTIATDKIFLLAGLLMWVIAVFVWLAPKPKLSGPVSGGH